jgi:DNA/RNA endonuclease G (NUC1)
MRIRIRSAAVVALALVAGSCSDYGVVSPIGRSGGPKVTEAVALAEVSALEGPPQIIITELMPDPAAVPDASGEWFEVFNAGPTEVDLQGWRIESNADAGFNVTTSLKVPSGGYATFANSSNPGFTPSYAYLNTQTGAGIILANSNPNEFIRLKDTTGVVVDEVRFAAGTNPDGTPAPVYAPQGGRSREVVNITLENTFIGGNNWRVPTTRYGPSAPTSGDFGTPGTGHYVIGEVGPIATVSVTPSNATVFQTAQQQFSAAAFDAAGNRVMTATFTWSSTEKASVDASGLATGLQPGDATITATAPNGRSGSASLHINEPPAVPPVRISEIHYDNVGDDVGEAIEIEGPAGTDLTGWQIVLYNGNGGASYGITRTLTGTIRATCGDRGVVFVSYLPNGIQNGDRDGIALVDAAGKVVELLSYEGTFTAVGGPANGTISTDIGVSESSSTSEGRSLQRNAVGLWQAPAIWTFGACNSAGTLPPVIALEGREAVDVPIPVGFEDQLFATLYAGGTAASATFTWSSETPDIVSVDEDGVVRALAAGVAFIRATAADGTTGMVPLLTHVAVPSTTAEYAGNAEFGEPTDRDASDDFIVHRRQYTASYNKRRGTPNWVSYNIDATHFGTQDRCDCFTFDPVLAAAGFSSYTTADYTGAGTFHGYAIDRGHLARSFDRTSGSLDNATTFYFTNIIPQAARLNQGPWAVMETYLGDLARFQNKEVYVVTGVAGEKGTVKNEGKITIPTHVWKVAVILPRNQGLADVDDYQDPEVVAVIVANDSTSTNPWETYKTTVDAVEALSGYDLLALLPNRVEAAVESGLDEALTLTGQLVTNGALSAGDGKWLTNKLELAVEHLAKGLRIPAVNQLEEILRRLDALVAAGKVSAADAASLRAIVMRAIQSQAS